MLQIHTPAALSESLASWKTRGQIIGFVPTMGALHDGHLSLVAAAKGRCDKVVVSIFVNPTQFAPHEDFNAYPRQEAEDLEKLRSASADIAYLPGREDLYPDGTDSPFKPGAAAEGLESDFRPHFFGGVVNVVSRLFDHVKPDTAFFGEKDFQQLQVIAEMVEAYNMPVNVVGVPTVRDAEGLALSSRNAYLSAKELAIARQLNKILFKAAADIAQGDESERVCARASEELAAAGFEKVDYVAARWNRLLAAAWLGKTRLIDNVPLSSSS